MPIIYILPTPTMPPRTRGQARRSVGLVQWGGSPRALSPAPTDILPSFHGNTEMPVSSIPTGSGAASDPSAWTRRNQFGKGSIRGNENEGELSVCPPLHPRDWPELQDSRCRCSHFNQFEVLGEDYDSDNDEVERHDQEDRTAAAAAAAARCGQGSSKFNVEQGEHTFQSALRGCKRNAVRFESGQARPSTTIRFGSSIGSNTNIGQSADDCRLRSTEKMGEDGGRVRSAGRQVGEHHNPGGGVRLTRFDGCRHGHSGQPAEELHERQRWIEKKATEVSVAVAEELEDNTNTVGQLPKFGGSNKPIWDSGAGRSICCKPHCPDYKLEASDHPGFAGPSGETIKVEGKTRVHFTDDTLNTTAEATFIVANKLTRPILSGGDLNDHGNVTISSSRGAFVVSEELARDACEALMPHAKLAFSRAGPGRLYELESSLLPQPSLFFRGRPQSR